MRILMRPRNNSAYTVWHLQIWQQQGYCKLSCQVHSNSSAEQVNNNFHSIAYAACESHKYVEDMIAQAGSKQTLSLAASQPL